MERTAIVQVEGGPRIRCRVPAELAIHEGDPCVVQGDRALEYGRVAVFQPSPGGPGDAAPPPDAPRILRRATLQDQAKEHETAVRSRMAAHTCAQKAKELNLALRLVNVRFCFDRSLLSILFTADDRVDFRQMIKDLSVEFHTRVEMRQIGVRDQAGMVGGLAACGRCLCCCTWLGDFESINVKMAKAQRISLNPVAISGMCGRLKCCLRYEYECYCDLSRDLPYDGSLVETASGRGVVTDVHILTRRVRVRMEDGRMVELPAEELRVAHGQCAAARVERADGPELAAGPDDGEAWKGDGA